ncbi:MAG: type III secretion protein [Planctomycetaceae bacterium]|nr:type III secretion protein [Planctomycetaceae bacterium]
MSAYPLAMLVGVCKLREDAAASAMRVAEANLVREEETERGLRADLAEYAAWRLNEEDRRYAELFDSEPDIKDMERFRAELAGLKERELEFEREIIESKRRQKELALLVEKARTAYLATVQESRKIDAHREDWLEDWLREVSRAEEIEMEEFSKGKPGPMDEVPEAEEMDEYS